MSDLKPDSPSNPPRSDENAANQESEAWTDPKQRAEAALRKDWETGRYECTFEQFRGWAEDSPALRVGRWLSQRSGFPDYFPIETHASFTVTYGDLRKVVAMAQYSLGASNSPVGDLQPVFLMMAGNADPAPREAYDFFLLGVKYAMAQPKTENNAQPRGANTGEEQQDEANTLKGLSGDDAERAGRQEYFRVTKDPKGTK